MRVSVCLGAILIPEYLDFHSGYSAPWNRIARIYSGISQTKAPRMRSLNCKTRGLMRTINLRPHAGADPNP